MNRYECDPHFPMCDDLPCRGHRVTKDIDLVARVLALTDGWDGLEDSDQAEDYWARAAELVAAVSPNPPPKGNP